MNTDRIYVFHGYGGENSLLPLVQYMQQKGHDVLMVDNQIYPLSREETFDTINQRTNHREVVYITSNHLWFDQYNYEDFHVKYPAMIAPVELLEFLKPIYCVYYPHDLSCFMHKSEYNWIDLFDLVLLPYESNEYYYLKRRCKTVEIVGWIKKTEEIVYEHPEVAFYAPVFFPSNINNFYSQLGTEGYADWFITYVDPSVPLKMPGIQQELYDILVRNGFTFLDSSVSVYQAAGDYNLIIGSGDSSIIYEAALSGLPVISVLDGMMSDKECMEHVGDIKGVYPLHPEEIKKFIYDINVHHTILETGPSILKPFDFERVYRLITETVKNT